MVTDTSNPFINLIDNTPINEGSRSVTPPDTNNLGTINKVSITNF